jgi:hypothetical protein
LKTDVWDYTNFVDAIDHWQALIAGLLGFAAAIIVVWITLHIESRKRRIEADTVRKSLAVELRQLIPHALGAHKALKGLALSAPRSNLLITTRMVESLSRVPAAIVYPANAQRIALLGSDAMDVVITYSLIELGRSGTASLLRSRTPDNITPSTVEQVSDVFLSACVYARTVLPNLRTGVPSHDEKDRTLIEAITAANAERYGSP